MAVLRSKCLSANKPAVRQIASNGKPVGTGDRSERIRTYNYSRTG
jgi:protein subunit release factor A